MGKFWIRHVLGWRVSGGGRAPLRAALRTFLDVIVAGVPGDAEDAVIVFSHRWRRSPQPPDERRCPGWLPLLGQRSACIEVDPSEPYCTLRGRGQ
jgi:hypothetical protein